MEDYGLIQCGIPALYSNQLGMAFSTFGTIGNRAKHLKPLVIFWANLGWIVEWLFLNNNKQVYGIYNIYIINVHILTYVYIYIYVYVYIQILSNYSIRFWQGVIGYMFNCAWRKLSKGCPRCSRMWGGIMFNTFQPMKIGIIKLMALNIFLAKYRVFFSPCRVSFSDKFNGWSECFFFGY